MAWPDLFDLDELPSWLQVPSVDTETATRVRRAAGGWLTSATGVASNAWPNPIPDDVWAWALELAAIAFRNPAAANSASLDDFNISYGDRARRAEILKAAASGYGGSMVPLYSFPDVDWQWTVAPAMPLIIQ